jgi:hypothetical protein
LSVKNPHFSSSFSQNWLLNFYENSRCNPFIWVTIGSTLLVLFIFLFRSISKMIHLRRAFFSLLSVWGACREWPAIVFVWGGQKIWTLVFRYFFDLSECGVFGNLIVWRVLFFAIEIYKTLIKCMFIYWILMKCLFIK